MFIYSTHVLPLSIRSAAFLAKNFFLLACFSCQQQSESQTQTPSSDESAYEVVVVGGGASGAMAGIQSARMGRKTLILEETVWLGGMLTSAGVSAVDGNYKLHSGLWEEFRQALYAHYGGADSVKTGWASNVLFEPNVGAEILRKMADNEKNLEVLFQSSLLDLKKTENGWSLTIQEETQQKQLATIIVVDATELGDVAKMAGIPYDIGMDSREESGEDIAPKQANNIIQDLTYVAVLEEFEKGEDKTIARPENYDPEIFYCACAGKCHQDSIPRKLWGCDQMMKYGRLPNGKMMINWPIYGNDYYVNAIESSKEERKQQFEKAKWFTKCYIYYLQTELGYQHIGLAENVFPTEDGFPMIPYHRESRRIKGMVRFTINDLAKPYEQAASLYKTGIAVGDYPVDHHHQAHPDHKNLPDLHFYPVPSYSVPLGALIPKNVENFIVAEKSISVTNLVNGTTRLQPVCLLIGQAAGTLAALAVEEKASPSEVSVRKVQQQLLTSNAYIMPYADVSQNDEAWASIQRIGATGILKGVGKNIGWENFTFFYPDSSVSTAEALEGIKSFYPGTEISLKEECLSVQSALQLISNLNSTTMNNEQAKEVWSQCFLHAYEADRAISRKEFAILMDKLINPFAHKIDIKGNVIL